MKRNAKWIRAAAVAVLFGGLHAGAGELEREALRRGVPEGDAPGIQWTPLHWAARRGDPQTLRQALARATEPDPRDALGRTPLVVAAQFGHEEAVRILIGAGADIQARDRWNVTPLRRMELLREVRGLDRSGIKALLREAGASRP